MNLEFKYPGYRTSIRSRLHQLMGLLLLSPALIGTTATTASALDGAPPSPADLLPPNVAKVLDAGYPKTPTDLRTIEQQLQKVVDKVMPATVGIQIGPSAGSGVIINADGLVLTAGHVAQEPDKDVWFRMPDGRRVRGKTLGLNRRIDSGMMKITEPGPWPYVPLAESNDVRAGQWVVATGHPGGYSEDRSPPVRLGRVLYANADVICTDCTLVGGDSGGPLFNMNGEVIGIHSRIGRDITNNFHVPISTYHDTWDRLAAGEAWGGRLPADGRGQARPYLGMHVQSDGQTVRVTQVYPNRPAQRAGIQRDDVILKFNGVAVSSHSELTKELWATRPNDRVQLEVQRGDETITVNLRVGGMARAVPGSPEYQPREPRQRSEPRNRRPEATPEPDGEKPQRPEKTEQPPQDQPKPATPQREVDPQPKQPPNESDSGKLRQIGSERLGNWGIEFDAVAARCVVSRVVDESLAAKAGLRPSDVIVRINDQAAADVQQLALHCGRADDNNIVSLQLLRNGKRHQIEIRIGE